MDGAAAVARCGQPPAAHRTPMWSLDRCSRIRLGVDFNDIPVGRRGQVGQASASTGPTSAEVAPTLAESGPTAVETCAPAVRNRSNLGESDRNRVAGRNLAIVSLCTHLRSSRRVVKKSRPEREPDFGRPSCEPTRSRNVGPFGTRFGRGLVRLLGPRCSHPNVEWCEFDLAASNSTHPERLGCYVAKPLLFPQLCVTSSSSQKMAV